MAAVDNPCSQITLGILCDVLIVMPGVPRTHGPVVGFLVPAPIVADAARSTHREWRASNPDTKGDSRTWNVWFADNGPDKASGFGKKWAQYRLERTVTTKSAPADSSTSAGGRKLGDIINTAKQQIADAAGVPLEAVRITVDLS